MGQGRGGNARHATVARISGIGIKRLAGLVDRVLELAADRERDVVDTHLRQAQGDALRIRQAVPVLDRLLGEEARADRKILTDDLAHASHDLAEHA